MIKSFLSFLFLLQFSASALLSQPKDYVDIKVFPDKNFYNFTDTVRLAIKAYIKSGFHINAYETNDQSLIKTSVDIVSDDYKISNLYFPEYKKYKFEFSSNEVNVYENEILIGLSLIPKKELTAGKYNVEINFAYQACDDKVCYPPKNIKETVSIEVKTEAGNTAVNKDIFSKVNFSNPTKNSGSSSETLSENPRTETAPADEDTVSRWIEENGLAYALMLIFLGGLALNLTPCVYPLIPITVSYFGAQTSGNKFQSIAMGGSYALGMSITYSALGVFAALTGGLLGTALQNPIVVIFIALILFSLGTSMFGLFEIRVPQKLAVMGSKNRSGLFGSLLMGLTVGFIAAPCIGPLVLGILVHVGKVGSAFYGFLLFFILSLGLGLPYVFLAASSSSISKLPRSGEWMESVKVIFGLILFGMALNTLEPLINAEIFNVILPLYIILAGIYLIFFDRKGLSSKVYTKIKFGIAVFAIIGGTWVLKPDTHTQEVEWSLMTSSEQIENSISTSSKPTMIDFYADWCAQCKELDKYTYTDPEVVELSKNFNNIKVDLTSGNEKITDMFNIKGLPVVVFLDPGGKEIKELRVTGFLKPEDFKTKMVSLNKFTAEK